MILPKENARDLKDIPADVRGELTFILVETIEEVIREALAIDLPPRPVMIPLGHGCVPVQNL